ncbi:alpha/beta hydrolase fold domain-containing protein [Streptomyces nitrosporeus]|uniref:alpha/beta hydrolase family protein n=1 Tax=Streptomyces nitrosporeus TaxID=28894 RepID=UPI0039A084DA
MSTVFGQLRYGGAHWRRIDLYSPGPPPGGPGGPGAPPRPAPGVVLVHGGFWRHERTAQDLEPLACALVTRGYRVAVVEYRPCWDQGAWPAAAEDCRDALAALAGHDARWRDAVLVGHSAGAHLLLSALAGSGAGARVLLLAPVAVPAEAARLGLGQGAAEGFLAAHLKAGGRYEDATPRLAPGDVEAASLVVAGSDQAVPAALTDHQYGWLADQGVPTRPVRVADARHMHLVNPERPAYGTVLRELDRLLHTRKEDDDDMDR